MMIHTIGEHHTTQAAAAAAVQYEFMRTKNRLQSLLTFIHLFLFIRLFVCFCFRPRQCS